MNATCHPGRKQLGGRGLCASCYGAQWRATHPAKCHPGRASVGKGVCDPCYRKAHGIKKPTRPHDPEKKRRATLRVYGLTTEAFDALARVQGGVCAVCRRPPGAQRLHVDHDHATGEVRGLLCGPCNRAIGLVDDDPTRLRGLADYLERQPVRVVRSA